MNEVASKYAVALFELALENNQLDIYQEQCRTIFDSLQENEEFFDVLNSKFLTVEEVNEIITKTYENFEIDVISLLKIIVENHRVNLLNDILITFNSLCNHHKGITEGILYSAFDLNKETISQIENAISKKENRQISLIFKIDPSLIGGVKVVINNHVYDASVKNKLTEMKQSLSNKEESL